MEPPCRLGLRGERNHFPYLADLIPKCTSPEQKTEPNKNHLQCDYDLPQIEYYGLRTKRMVGDVLTKNGVVEPIKSGSAIIGYRLVDDCLSDRRRAALSALCDDRVLPSC